MSLEKYDKLDMIEPSKTAVFRSPIEGNDVLVRTGTIADGSCMYHSVLYTNSKKYIRMSNEDKIDFVKRLRKSIADSIDIESWEKMSDRLVSKISYQSKINYILNYLYKKYSKNVVEDVEEEENKVFLENILKNDISDAVCKMILEIMPLDYLEKEILPKVYGITENKSLDESKNEIIKECKDQMYNKLLNIITEDQERIDFFVNKFVILVGVICDYCKEICYKNYLKNIMDTSIPADEFSLDLIADKFDRDIYFIDGKNRLPYPHSNDKNIKGRLSIIVLWINESHYEIVGRVLESNKIERVFDPDDELIKRIKNYLSLST